MLFAAACLSCGGGQREIGTGATPAPTLPVQPAPLSAGERAMLNEVARLRALPAPDALTIGYVSRAQLPAVLDSTLTGDDHRWFAATTTLYRLLGYIGPEDDFLEIYRTFASEAVIGLYDPSRKTVWVVAGDAAGGFAALTPAERATLAHEFVHALQDARFDLAPAAKRAQQDHDRDIAWAALAEGDAVTHERLHSGRSGMAPGGLNLLFADVGGSPAGIPAPIERAFRFPYNAGADWVRGLREREGTTGIDRLFEAGPATTAAILHGAAVGGPPPPALPDLSGLPGSGWQRQSGGTLGEFEWQNFLLQRVRALDAATAAAGLTSDRYEVYVRGGASILVARVLCRDEAAAAAFRTALRTWADAAGLTSADRPRYSLAAASGSNTIAASTGSGREVVVVIGTGEKDVEAAMRALTGG
ncbi:MAG: hypothetical protein ACKVT1_14995 [Dehalococcoidia bacterium]